MTINSRVNSLLERLSNNARRFSERTDTLIDRQNASAQTTDQGLEDLRTAQQNRVASPDAAFQTLSQFITTSPGAAFGAGVLANDVDFANFVNKRIDDARENLDFQFKERQADLQNTNLVADILSQQLSADTLPVSTEINAVENSLNRQNRLDQVKLQAANRAAAAAAKPVQQTQSQINNTRSNAALALSDQLSNFSATLSSDEGPDIGDLASFVNGFSTVLSNSKGLGITDFSSGDLDVLGQFDSVLEKISSSILSMQQESQSLAEVSSNGETTNSLRDGSFSRPISEAAQEQASARQRQLNSESDALMTTLSALQSSIENSTIDDSTKQILLSRVTSVLP